MIVFHHYDIAKKLRKCESCDAPLLVGWPYVSMFCGFGWGGTASYALCDRCGTHIEHCDDCKEFIRENLLFGKFPVYGDCGVTV